MKRIHRLFLAFIILTGFMACKDFADLEEIDFSSEDAEFAIPIAKAEFTVADLLDNLNEGTNIFVDPDGTLRLNYKGRLAIQTSLDVFSSIQATLTQFPIFPVLDTLIALPFGAPDSVDIDFMKLKTGEMSYQILSGHTEPINFSFEFLNVSKDGETLKGSRVLSPFPASDTIDLAEYLLTPINDSIYFRYKATKLNGEPVTLASFLMSIRDITFSYAEGYFGQIVHEGAPDTIEIEFFDDWTRGDIYFEEPTINIYTQNSFGIPTRSVIHYFQVKTVNQNVLDLQSPYITNGVDFAYPKLPDEVGQTKTDTFTFNKHNSNIDIILGAGPEAIYYDVDALTNPDNDPDLRGFITDSSAYEVQVEVDLPLYGKSSGFAVRDTIDWDFSTYEDVEYAEFKVVSENEMGLKVAVQGYFIDDDGIVLDSLFNEAQAIIEAAPVDPLGLPVQTVEKTTFAFFPADRFQKIKPAKHIVLNAAFFTTNDGNTSVRILNEHGIEVRMGMKLGL